MFGSKKSKKSESAPAALGGALPKETDYVPPKERLKEERVQEMVKRMKESLGFPLDGDFHPPFGPPITDTTILRFLIARDFVFDDSLKLLQDSLSWREKLGDISYKDCEPELRMGAFHYHGHSKTGSPICIVNAGRFKPSMCDVKRLVILNSIVIEDLIRANKDGEAYTVIIDFEDFGLSNMSFDLVRPLIDIWNLYYPEVIEVEYHINTPWVMRTIWSWVKPLLPERTKNKIIFLPSDFKPFLAQYIDAPQLEAKYGGSSEWVAEGWESATAEDPKLGVLVHKDSLPQFSSSSSSSSQ
eukprot:TRINITY_DN1299_c0_g1_i1.p1 TRINITY_DN1299_c0_g1~~TRINITY_DN1299_c0_g1_i1.p1  ORF type:complete len:329 (-),score=138.59 TRINITY_DN1299_c0_g1_i1:101-997(-)